MEPTPLRPVPLPVSRIKHRVSRPGLIVSLGLLAGCAGLQPAASSSDDPRYYCRPGSMLKYTEPLAPAYPGYWIPMPRGGSCKGY